MSFLLLPRVTDGQDVEWWEGATHHGPAPDGPPPKILRTTRAMKRMSLGRSHAASSASTTTNPSATSGYVRTSHSRPAEVMSSATESPRFEKGSGDVLAAARVPAF